ncbi:MAG: polysaccharide lyase domain-containing protein [Planctomycetota bacterium]
MSMDVRAPFLPVLLLVLCVFAAGCTSSADPAPPGDPNGDTPPPADPPPADPPPADPPPDPDSPPPSGGVGNSTLDPGFNSSTNLIEVFFDNGLTSRQNGDALEAVLETVAAGDRVVIHAGEYTMDSRLSIWAVGTEQDPITIEAAADEAVIIRRDDESQNLIDFDRASYVTVRGIEWIGGSIGIRLIDVDYLFFVDNEVHDTGDTAIAANSGDTSYLYFVNNHVHHTNGHGEGFYLGANYGDSITHHTYVVGNWIHDTGDEQGDGVEIKDGSYACVIADNWIERTNWPGVIVYGTQGQSERNIIERNVILDSNEGGIQAAADCIIRNNLIVGALDACIASQPHQTATPSNLEIVHNTLVNDDVCLRTNSWGGGTNIVFANNALYSASGSEYQGGTGNATVLDNVSVGSLAAFVDLDLTTGRDATPAAGSPLIGAGAAAHQTFYDLNGRERSGSIEVGAVDLP